MREYNRKRRVVWRIWVGGCVYTASPSRTRDTTNVCSSGVARERLPSSLGADSDATVSPLVATVHPKQVSSCLCVCPQSARPTILVQGVHNGAHVPFILLVLLFVLPGT